jgi:hypothetical protein
MVNATVYFVDSILGEAGFLKVAIDVGRHNETSHRAGITPFSQNLKSMMRLCLAVEIQSVAVESPGEGGIGGETSRVCHLDEAFPQFPIRRIGIPEAFVPPKVRQPRVDPHPCSSGDKQSIGIPDDFRSSLDSRVHLFTSLRRTPAIQRVREFHPEYRGSL